LAARARAANLNARLTDEGLMRAMRVGLVAALALLAGCGGQGGSSGADGESSKTGELPSASTDAAAPVGGAAPDAAQATPGVAQIAYSYGWTFELPTDAVAATLAAHRKLCAEMGPARCQLLGSSEASDGDGARTAKLDLRVAPAAIADFGRRLEASVAAADGRTISATVEGEDLTAKLIDAEAALKAKRTLRDRLQALLERREGKLADLLETEKALSQTQQELDAATAMLAELRRRVALSDVTIDYRSTRPLLADRGRPLADAFAEAGHTLAASLASLVTFLVAALPWALLVGFVVWAARAWRRRRG
jgi:hypothetical protein